MKLTIKNTFKSGLNSLYVFFPLCLLTGLIFAGVSRAQTPVDLSDYSSSNNATIMEEDSLLHVTWPVGDRQEARFSFDLQKGKALFNSIQLNSSGEFQEIAGELDPQFILTVGNRNLERNGWNVFFDSPPYGSYESYDVTLDKEQVKVTSEGSRTKIMIDKASAGSFNGAIQVTLFSGTPLIKMEAVMETTRDSLAIVYDAGLAGKPTLWEEIFWSDPQGYIQSVDADAENGSKNMAVKYRTIIGESKGGSMAIFPPPHQYFYPLDNAFNTKFTWFGNNYRGMIPSFGIGIRQDLMGDMRHVPWFNAPPHTKQRLSFFTLLSAEKDGQVLEEVKQFTNSDTYKPLSGYKTFASHFHTEHIMDLLTHKPLPDIPGHVKVMKDLGVNIMHQGEFHLAGNPRDPGPRRLPQLELMFEEFKRLSEGNFLMLPGEEPNVHFGGHWMNIFPEPVYWIMSRKEGQPFVEEHDKYGKVYRVGSKEDMLKLLEEENGLAWTAHPRIKGSRYFPDKYKDEPFYKSDRFLGSAWKAMPADLSQPELGKRVLDLMDDQANWGQKKQVLAEADLFRLEPTYEVYGPMNINYLQLDKLPSYEEGWSSILKALRAGKFFSTTGEVLLPKISIKGKGPGETVSIEKGEELTVNLDVEWTFPLNYLEVISGDGSQVQKEVISLHDTKAFGEKTFTFPVDLDGQKWVRVEVWDVAANGAFTQQIWLE